MSKENGSQKIKPSVCAISCYHVTMEMEYPRTKADVESNLWYIYHEKTEVFIDKNGVWFLRAKRRCSQLSKNGRCKVYGRQPEICSESVRDSEEFEGEARKFKDIVRYHFKTEIELLEYLKENRPALFKKVVPGTRSLINGRPKKRVAPPKPVKDGEINCLDCASCCTYLNIVVERPTDAEDVNELFWYLYHEGTELYLDEDGDWSVVFASRCKQLDENNLCRVYTRRPYICKQFSTNNCHGDNFNESVKKHFVTDKTLIAYLKEKRPGLFKKLDPKVRALA